MSQPLRMGLLSPDVRAFLRERYEQWQTALPWYKRAPEIVEEAPLYLSLERLVRELRAELADAYAQRDRQREKADVATRLYLEKQSELARSLFRIVIGAAESGVKLPTDDEEAAGRTIDVFVREMARGYKRARLAIAILQNERGPWRSEALRYREGITWEVSCLGCARLLTQHVEKDAGLGRLKGAPETIDP